MHKNILIISTSLRASSNSQILASRCYDGAKDAGHEVNFISLKNKEIKYCIGCYSCYKNGNCVLKDDMKDILKAMMVADVIIFATPIYYYGMSGQLKTLLDRSIAINSLDYKFKDVYMIATAADDDINAANRAYDDLNAWISCFNKASLKGLLSCSAIDDKNEVLSHEDMLLKAYNLGKSI